MLKRLSKKLGLDKAAYFLVRKHPKWSILAILVFILIIVLGYWFEWDWKGFIDGYNKVTIQKSGKNTTTTTELPQAKSLWDWLSVLCIPVAIAFGSLWFTAQQSRTQDAENEDNQREAALKEYIGKVSDLLLNHNLRGSTLSIDSDLVIKRNWASSHEEVRTIARAWTLTVLARLDSKRKVSVLQFLYESGLIRAGHPIVSLRGADLASVSLAVVNLNDVKLSGAFFFDADLSYTNLSGANFSGGYLSYTNLSGANFSDAYLSYANLSGANFFDANLSGAYLIGANLTQAIHMTPKRLAQAYSLKGTIMPDGSSIEKPGDPTSFASQVLTLRKYQER